MVFGVINNYSLGPSNIEINILPWKSIEHNFMDTAGTKRIIFLLQFDSVWGVAKPHVLVKGCGRRCSSSKGIYL